VTNGTKSLIIKKREDVINRQE